MAVDTERRRQSMLGFGGGDHLLIVPDGAVSDSDRQTLLGNYYGFDYVADDTTGKYSGNVGISPSIGIGL